MDLPLSIEEEDKGEGSQDEEEEVPEKEETKEKEEPLYGKVVYIVEALHPEVVLGVIDASDNRFHPLDARIHFMDYHCSRSILISTPLSFALACFPGQPVDTILCVKSWKRRVMSTTLTFNTNCSRSSTT